jgi:hypothetical protein
MVIALRLAKAGYAGGDPERVLKMRTDMVLGAIQYEAFINDYERAYIEINREDNE